VIILGGHIPTYPGIQEKNKTKAARDRALKRRLSLPLDTRAKIDAEIDAFLQRAKNKPFWLWGEKNHRTDRYCVDCLTKYTDENTTYCAYCNKEWIANKDDNIKAQIYPRRTLVYNDDLLLTDPLVDKDACDCCFTHMVGNPRKDFKFKIPGTDKYNRVTASLPIFDWQRPIFEAFQREQDNLIIKATGIGGSALKIRQTQYAVCTGYDYANTEVPIIVGPQRELSKRMVQRYKDLYPFPIIDDVNTAEINNCWLHIFSSRNIAGVRSLENPRELILDEFDYFPVNDMANVFDTIFRYPGKSGSKINAITTPARPFGYAYTMEHENPGNMNIIKLHYSIGYGTIYTFEAIEEQKLKPGWEREYCLTYGGTTGNYFDPVDIKRAIMPYDLRTYHETTIVMGIDSGWSTSWFAVVIMMWHKFKLYVMHVERHKRPYPQFMIDKIVELRQQYNVYKILIDGSDPEFIYMLKDRLRDYPPTQYAKNMSNPYDYHDVPPERYQDMKVIPTSFYKKPMQFLTQDRMLLQQDKIAIGPQFKELISGLYEVYVQDGQYQKRDKEYNDIVDAFSETCDFYLMKSRASF